MCFHNINSYSQNLRVENLDDLDNFSSELSSRCHLHFYALSRAQKISGLALITIGLIALIIGSQKIFNPTISYSLMGCGAGISLISFSAMLITFLAFKKKVNNIIIPDNQPINCSLFHEWPNKNTRQLRSDRGNVYVGLYYENNSALISFHMDFYRTEQIQNEHCQ